MKEFFEYQGDELFAENVALSEIADQYGTPCFVYSRAAIEHNYHAYEQSLGDCSHLICYAVKANSNLAVLNLLARLGAGFDIVSGGELHRVLRAGGDPAKIIFSGVGKGPKEIEQALNAGILCFNVESTAELERINQIAGQLDVQAPVSLRINPDVDAGTHPYISTGMKENKFGIESGKSLAAYQQAAAMPHLQVTGIDCHIGSQLTDTGPFLSALERLLELIDQLHQMGIPLEHIDIGGGLGVKYQAETPPSPATLITAVREQLGDRKLTLLLEPGRSIVASAGIFLTRVEYLKHTTHKNFSIVDGAMNDLLRPALYGAWQDIVPVNKASPEASMLYDVVGPVCESADFLGKDRQLAVAAGDLLAVRSSGAYGFVMSSNYNSRSRAAEIMVDGTTVTQVRKRETLAAQLALESMLS